MSTLQSEQRRLYGHEDSRNDPDCNIIAATFMSEGDLWEFTKERRMAEVMTRESP